MSKTTHKSHDQGVRDFPGAPQSDLLVNGSPTEELSADSDITRGWATYTDLNPMDADVLNRRSGARQTHSAHEGPVGPSEAMHTDKSDDF
jgi:hypothetical protein